MIGVPDIDNDAVVPPDGAVPEPETAAEPEAQDEADAEPRAEGDPLSTVTAQRDQYLDDLRRLQAEFENYRKRTVKQQTEHLERAAESLVRELLPVLDAIDLARAHPGSGDGGGLEPVANQLTEVLRKEGLERVDPKGQPFDPLEHDAVMHEPAEGDDADGAPEVSEVMRAGYRWRGRVLRPAMVKVRG